MPRRSVLSLAERENLFELPLGEQELIRHYTPTDTDLALIEQRRGDANKLGMAVQLSLLCFPGQGLRTEHSVSKALLNSLSQQLDLDPICWSTYAERDATRRERFLELRNYLGLESFKLSHHRQCLRAATELAMQTDKGIVLAENMVDSLRKGNVIMPVIDVVERVCAQAITRADRRIHAILADSLDSSHQVLLDELLERKPNSKTTWLTWLRQPPGKPNSRYILEHIKRLEHWQSLRLPAGIARQIHQNRLLKIAREGAQMTPADLSRFEPKRRYATLVALAVESTATVTDEIIDLHDRIIGKFFNTAKNKHKKQFHSSGKAINNKVRLYARIGQALLDAKLNGYDPYTAIENIMPWKSFSDSVTEAQNLAQPETFDSLQLIGENYPTLGRYAPQLLNTLKLQAAPAAKGLLAAIETLRDLNDKNIRKCA